MRITLHTLRSRLTPIYGPRETEAIIRLIFEHLKHWRPVDIVMHSSDTLSPYMQEKVMTILERLERHEPIQYILGQARFYGLTLSVEPSVLIPRPETEQLVDMVRDSIGQQEDTHILDAGTGSGCIALALARNLRFPSITAIDISEQALSVAKKNAAALHATIRFLQADILTLATGSLPGEPWDAIVSNPPYIGAMEAAAMEANVLDYEPHSALFVPQNDPLMFYRPLSAYGLRTLRPGAGIYFEINPLYADSMREMMTGMGYHDVTTHLDTYGKVRFLTAIKPADDE